MSGITSREHQQFHQADEPTRHNGYEYLSLCRGKYAKFGADHAPTRCSCSNSTLSSEALTQRTIEHRAVDAGFGVCQSSISTRCGRRSFATLKRRMATSCSGPNRRVGSSSA
jgi:hypothetical protein